MKKLYLFLIMISISWSSFSQNSVKGFVKDENGMPIPGVNVLEKGKVNGVTTDFNGSYKIKVSPNAVLIYSYIGYKNQEVATKGKVNIDVNMDPETNSLKEVIVVGYGKQKKESVLGAISQVKGTELLETGSSNVTNALSGLSAGLTVVQSSGRPGADSGEIFIRGNADPLVLVDGVEIVGGFSNINPRDIESVSTLKDGAATAVYGIRGANGVIIITTKRGKIGKPKISFNSEYSIKDIENKPEMVDAYTAQKALNVGILNDQSYLSGYSSDAVLAHYKDQDLPYMYPNVDWFKTMLKKSTSSFNQTIDVQGGTDFVKYYASAGYLQEGDITKVEQYYNYDPTYKFKRYSFRGNLDFTLSKTTKLKTSVSNRYENVVKPGDSTESNFLFLYNSPSGGAVPIYPAEVMLEYPDPLYPGLAEPRFGSGANIYGSLNNGGNFETFKNVFSIDFELEQELDFITKGLTFTGKYNYISTYNSSVRTQFDTTIQARPDTYTLLRDGTWFSFEGRNYERPLEYTYGDENAYTNTSNKIYANEQIAYQRAQLAYDRSFGKHNVTGLALVSRNKRLTNTAYPYYNEDWVGRATYNYDTHYFLELSGSYNGDETFARGYRFKFFPAVGVGINLAKEKLIADNFPALNNFKVRYSYGETGSKTGLGDNRWQYLSFYDYVAASSSNKGLGRYWFGENVDKALTVIKESQLGNEQLTWATVSKQNIGVDFGLFQNKISGNVEFFKDTRVDLINRPSGTVPSYFGSSVALPYANLGASESHGYEVELTYKNRTSFGLNYAITGFYGFNENRITKSAADGAGTQPYVTVAGKPNGAVPLLQTNGFFQSIDEIVNYPSYAGKPGLGDYRYIDYNANGTVIGSGLEDQVRFDLPESPKKSYSLKLSASYKQWSVSALLNGVTGHKGLVDSDLSYLLPNGTATGRYDQLDYWTPTNTDAAYPAIHVLANPNLLSGDTSRIVNLDYLKLRSLNVGYTFDMSKSKNISNLKLYVNGNNLLTFSHIKYGDPEGNSPGTYPVLRRINLGLNVSF